MHYKILQPPNILSITVFFWSIKYLVSKEALYYKGKNVYMSKTYHEYDIVDIVTISTKFCRYRYKHTVTISSISSISLRYRQSFVDIDTSTLWRYRRYRYVIDTYRGYRNDIDKVSSTSILAHCDDIVDIVTISTLSHCRWIKSPILVDWCQSTLKSGSNFGQADKNKTIV